MPGSTAQAASSDSEKWPDILTALGCKWGYHILNELAEEGLRFNELKRGSEELNSSALSERLKGLEAAALVDRTVSDSSPPAVTYSITERGRRIRDLLAELEATWARTG